MKVTAKSEQPHLRAPETPYTQMTIRVSPSSRGDAEKKTRSDELEFLALLGQALNPKIPLKRVIDALRNAIDPDQSFDFGPGERK